MTSTPSAGSDQTARMNPRSLIGAFAEQTKYLWNLNYLYREK